jgi:acyl-coenzyme A thioesterase PaaI-like protein
MRRVSTFEDLAETYAAHNRLCAACGTDNPFGLTFSGHHPTADTMVATVRFEPHHEGGNGLVHGGLIATALDEILGRCACVATGVHAVTARLEIDYRAAVTTPGECELVGRLERVDGRKVWMTGSMSRADELVAQAHGLWISTGPALARAAP